MALPSPIGVFDSGLGGLTVLKEITTRLPQYDYVYLGDNARTPYGNRSFETVYQYTLQCVKKLFELNCPLVIVACNTASAKALRNIQQLDLPQIAPDRRVLGVIRPTTEVAGKFSASGKVGILGTSGTVQSNSYVIELEKFFPGIQVFQEACPMWVPLVENNESASASADPFIQKNIENLMKKGPGIDTVILGCTHYPILADKIRKFLPSGVRLVSQGEIVAESLADYLKRHPAMEQRLTKGGKKEFYTTDSPENFDRSAGTFWQAPIRSQHMEL